MLKKIVENWNVEKNRQKSKFKKFGINCTLERSSIIKILKKTVKNQNR